MKMSELKTDADGYIVDADGKRVVFYECDPQKNFLCPKELCRFAPGNDGEIGLCSSTPEPSFCKEGGRAFYKKWNGEYMGREYIEEVTKA